LVKSAVISSFLSQTRDRFHEYNEVRDLEQRLRMVSEMEAVDGVEAVYPYEVCDPLPVRGLMDRFGLKWAAVNVNVKAEADFRSGGLTSSRREVREKAVRFIKEAKDFARAVGANKVTCCPLGDGYEYHFHAEYAGAWKRLVDTIGEAGSYLPTIPLFIEYKPAETRGRCFVDTAAKALLLLKDIGIDQIGVTIDFGHSVWGQENPAEALSLVAESRFPYYVHINDNDSRWDWDFFVGSRNLLSYVEFLWYLQEYRYDDYLTSDTSPTRLDVKGTFETNARVTNRIWNRLLEVDRGKLRDLVRGEDYLKTWRFIEEEILRL